MENPPRYEQIEHTADIGIVVRGATLADLFANAAFALYDTIVATESVETREAESLSLQAQTPEELLHDWLNEHLYLFSARGLILPHIEVHAVSPTEIRATARGVPFDPALTPLKTEIKAVTWHQLSVVNSPSGWSAQVIFDV